MQGPLGSYDYSGMREVDDNNERVVSVASFSNRDRAKPWSIEDTKHFYRVCQEKSIRREGCGWSGESRSCR